VDSYSRFLLGIFDGKEKGKREKRKNDGADSYSRFLLGILAVGRR